MTDFSAWDYVATYSQPGSTDGDKVNYPIRITITYNASRMRSDFGDIRFALSDGTELSYSLDSYTAGSTATFTVLIPSLPASPAATIIKIYSGNSAVTTTSNPASVSLWYDNFSGTSIDTTKWTANVQGSLTETINNLLQITDCNATGWLYAGNGPGNQNQSKVILPNNYEIHTKQKIHQISTEAAECGIALVDASNKTQIFLGHWNPSAGAAGGINCLVQSAKSTTNAISGYNGQDWPAGHAVSDLDTRNYRIVVNGLNVSVYDGITHLFDTTLAQAASKLSILASKPDGYAFFDYYEFDYVQVLQTTPNPPVVGTMGSWQVTGCVISVSPAIGTLTAKTPIVELGSGITITVPPASATLTANPPTLQVVISSPPAGAIATAIPPLIAFLMIVKAGVLYNPDNINDLKQDGAECNISFNVMIGDKVYE